MTDDQLATALNEALGGFVGRVLTPEVRVEMEAEIARVSGGVAAAEAPADKPGVVGVRLVLPDGRTWQLGIEPGVPA